MIRFGRTNLEACMRQFRIQLVNCTSLIGWVAIASFVDSASRIRHRPVGRLAVQEIVIDCRQIA
jgi:hypothetical protein